MKKILLSILSIVLVLSFFVCSLTVSAADTSSYNIDYSYYTNSFISVGMNSALNGFYNYETYLNKVPFDINDGISSFYNLQGGYLETETKNPYLTYLFLPTTSGTYPNRVWSGRLWFSNNYKNYQNKSLSTFQSSFLTIPKDYKLHYRFNFFLPGVSYEKALELYGSDISLSFYIGPNSNDIVDSKCSIDYIGRCQYTPPVPYDNSSNTSPIQSVFISVIGSITFSKLSYINSVDLSITGLDRNVSGLLIDRPILFTRVSSDSAWTAAQKVISGLGSALSNVSTVLKDKLTSLGTTIGGYFTDLWDSIGPVLNTIGSKITALGNTIGGFFDDLWNNHLKGAFNSIDTWLSDLGDYINGQLWYIWENHLSAAFDDIGDWFTDLGNDISGFFTNLGNKIGGFFTDLWNNHLKGAFDDIGDWFTDLGNDISGFFTNLGNKIGGFFTDLWNNHLKPAFDDIGDWFTTLGDNISTFFTNLGNTIGGFFTDLWEDNLKPAFDSVVSALTGFPSWLSDISDIIFSGIESFINMISSIFQLRSEATVLSYGDILREYI